MFSDGAGVYLEYVHSSLLIGQWYLDLPVETSRTKQRRVERVRPVGGHDHLHLAEDIKTVHLIQ